MTHLSIFRYCGLLLLPLVTVGAEPSPAWTENWPQWRGPLATGVALHGDPPLEWGNTKNIRWKAELKGRSSATPIVWKDQVFVLSAFPIDRAVTEADVPKSESRFEKKTSAPKQFYRFLVQSFDRGTGQLRWEQVATEQVPHEGHHNTHSYAGGSPATDGERLYVSFGSRGNYCYTLDGKLLWQREFGRLNTRLGWGEAVTPVIHSDSLLLNWDQEADSSLICLDKKSGNVRWRIPRPEASSWNTPFVVTQGDRALVLVNGTTKCRAYDLAAGKEIWSCGGMTVNAIPSPLAEHGVAYFMSGYKGALAVAVPLDSSGDITDTNKMLWKHGRGTPYVPSPLLANDRLWFTQANDALLTILDAKSGQPIIDHERLPGLKNIYASPVAAGGRVYIVGRDGTTLVLKQGDKLEVLATNRLDDEIDASPAIVGKELYLRGQKYLYCIGEK